MLGKRFHREDRYNVDWNQGKRRKDQCHRQRAKEMVLLTKSTSSSGTQKRRQKTGNYWAAGPYSRGDSLMEKNSVDIKKKNGEEERRKIREILNTRDSDIARQ